MILYSIILSKWLVLSLWMKKNVFVRKESIKSSLPVVYEILQRKLIMDKNQ